MRVLAAVHRTDGYPVAWPADPSSWLSPDGVQGAWVAESGGTVVGHAVVTGRGDDAKRAADRLVALSRLFVAPYRRGDGVATALVRTAVPAARRSGTRVVADVVEGTAAVGCYERMGWRLVDRRPAGWTAPDGREPTSRVHLSPGLQHRGAAVSPASAVRLERRRRPGP